MEATMLPGCGRGDGVNGVVRIRIVAGAVALGLASAGWAQAPAEPQATEATPAPATGTALPVPPPPPPPDPFTDYVKSLRARALAAGVSGATFDREVSGLAFNPRVVRSDRSQPGNALSTTPGDLNFAPYRRQHVDAARINGGRSRYRNLRPVLAGIEQRTGVSAAVTMAIFGHETGYGSFSGRTDLLQSFASLAFEGRRRELFAAEFIATLQLIERGIPRSRLIGSWAGATGYPQFLPSVYLRLGTDGDGDGKADIWTNQTDALASISAYLVDAGWKRDVPWGVAVQVPATLDRAALRSPLASPRCPRVFARLSRWRTMAEWKALGVRIAGAPAPADDEQARLIEPDGADATAYLVTTNYNAILDYNCSNFYALSVGLLADEVARPPAPVYQPAPTQTEVQTPQ
jgi:membrane-bound lytic murein transglycosylase B